MENDRMIGSSLLKRNLNCQLTGILTAGNNSIGQTSMKKINTSETKQMKHDNETELLRSTELVLKFYVMHFSQASAVLNSLIMFLN